MHILLILINFKVKRMKSNANNNSLKMGEKMKFGLDEKVVKDIISIIEKYDEVERACIFGSRARGDYRNGSDIDIALFGESLTNEINTKIYFEIDDLYLPYKIDLINFNSLGKDDKIKESILREGVEIYAK